MLIVGEQEENDGTVSVRRHGGEDLGAMSVDAFAKAIQSQVAESLKTFEV
jgi:threonyl-tRNA synthetase